MIPHVLFLSRPHVPGPPLVSAQVTAVLLSGFALLSGPS